MLVRAYKETNERKYLDTAEKAYNSFLTTVENGGVTYISENQEKWIENSKEKNFKAGESLIVGRYVPHGTAKKTKGPPRWACLIRVGV